MRNLRTAATTLHFFRHAVASLIGYPPVMYGMLTRRLRS